MRNTSRNARSLPSCPRFARASTPVFGGGKGVDGRTKSGHDVGGVPHAIGGRSLRRHSTLASAVTLGLAGLALSACDPVHFPVYNMTDCPIGTAIYLSDGDVRQGVLRPKTKMVWWGPPITLDITDIKIEDSFGRRFDFPREELFRLTDQTSIDSEFGFNGKGLELIKWSDRLTYNSASEFQSYPADFPACKPHSSGKDQ
jgi:hypothetical protein